MIRALSSKAIALAWGTSCTILLSAYTAGLVAAATSANFVASGVTGPYSLVNTMVGTYAGDTHAFLRYGWIGTPVDSYSYSGSWSLYNQLMNTSSGITSVVMDTAWCGVLDGHSMVRGSGCPICLHRMYQLSGRSTLS